MGCWTALRSRVRWVSDTSRTRTGRQAVDEAVTHGSVVEGPSWSEGRERNAMGEVRQAKGSQRKPGQTAEELPTTSPAATGEQKLLGRKKKREQCFLQPREASSTADPQKTWSKETLCKPRQLKYLFDNLWRVHFCQPSTSMVCRRIQLQLRSGKFKVNR